MIIAHMPPQAPLKYSVSDELAELHQSVEFPGCRAEILDGRIVVSPTPIDRHDAVVIWLVDAFRGLCEEHGWVRRGHATVDLPGTREWIEPDFLIKTYNPDQAEQWLTPARVAILVVEVVSPRSSARDDCEVKPHSCALSAVPIYLVIDPQERRLVVHSRPSDEGYQSVERYDIGETP